MLITSKNLIKKHKLIAFAILLTLLGVTGFAILSATSHIERIQSLDGYLGAINTQTSESAPQLAWNRTFGGVADSFAYELALDSNSNIYVVGNTFSTGTGFSDVLLLKYSPDGVLLWNRTWGVPNRNEFGRGIAIDNQNNIYLTGKTFFTDPTWGDVLLLKYDPTGNYIWNRTLGAGSGIDEGWDLIYSDGVLWITGLTRSLGGTQDEVLLAKYAINGSQLGAYHWGGIGNDIGFAIALSGSVIFIAGQTNSFGAGGADALLVKFDTNGTKIGNWTWGGNQGDSAKDLIFDGAGFGYLTGSTENNALLFLVKFNGNGQFIWNRIWGSKGTAVGEGIDIDSNNNPYVVVQMYDYGAGHTDVLMMGWDSSGNQPWHTVWGGLLEDASADIEVNNGAIYICGSTTSFGSGGYDFFLLKYSTTTATSEIPGFQSPITLFTLLLILLISTILAPKVKRMQF